ncbi:MAG: carboxymuconolactone decarboxylase family protein [Mycobacterium sp.]
MTRVPPAGRQELGLLNWVISKVAARAIRAPEMHLFTTLGRHRLLFLSFLPYSGVLLNWGKLPKADKELVILRVGHLRGSEYELQQHRRLARSRGVDTTLQDKIFTGPTAAGLTTRQCVLLVAVDEFVADRNLSDDTFAALADHLTKEQIIEFCALTGHYDAIAAIAATLRVPMDFPE